MQRLICGRRIADKLFQTWCFGHRTNVHELFNELSISLQTVSFDVNVGPSDFRKHKQTDMRRSSMKEFT